MQEREDLGISIKKEDNFTEWFVQLMIKAEIAEYSSVSGCMVIRPYGYEMWEKIKEETDKEFKKIGIKNAYFPLFIPESLLSKEKEHVAGFAPEVAWVTHGGETKLGERLAVRPTSETIMYESYAKWIRSWRDLPMLINQWNNVVRWEFKHPVLFFRTREFLWNELHTVFESEKQAKEHGNKVMSAYKEITENIMAMPGIYGRKTESEKFAGGVFSEKNHHYIEGGKIIEGTCFHYDGQNFSKAFKIKFKTRDGKEEYAYQNTHAISTRMLGAMFAMHSDNKGLVLPPKIAPRKIVIIPLKADQNPEILKKAKEIEKQLQKFDAFLDDREEVTPGYKFNEWELKGIPIRVEIGPKDLEKDSVLIVKRNTGQKIPVKIKELQKEVGIIIENMHKELFGKAEKILKENIIWTEKKSELLKEIEKKKIVVIPLCKEVGCEDILKAETGGAKTLFIDPENTSIKSKKCLFCSKKADYFVYTGKTY